MTIREAQAEARGAVRDVLTEGPQTRDLRKKYTGRDAPHFYGFGAAMRGDRVASVLLQNVYPPVEDDPAVTAITQVAKQDFSPPNPEKGGVPGFKRLRDRPVVWNSPSSPDYGSRYEVPQRSIRTAGELMPWPRK